MKISIAQHKCRETICSCSETIIDGTRTSRRFINKKKLKPAPNFTVSGNRQSIRSVTKNDAHQIISDLSSDALETAHPGDMSGALRSLQKTHVRKN